MKNNRSEFNYIRKKYFDTHEEKCTKCGSTIGIELHHKISLTKGGSNEETNLIPLCSKCHTALHNLDRSELTKVGIEKARNKEIKYHLIALEDLYEVLENENFQVSTSELIDIIFSLPIRKNVS